MTRAALILASFVRRRPAALVAGAMLAALALVVRHPTPGVPHRPGHAARPRLQDRPRQRALPAPVRRRPHARSCSRRRPTARDIRAALHAGEPRRRWRACSATWRRRATSRAILTPLTVLEFAQTQIAPAHDLASRRSSPRTRRKPRTTRARRRRRRAARRRRSRKRPRRRRSQKVADEFNAEFGADAQALPRRRRPDARQPEVRRVRDVRRRRQAAPGLRRHLPGRPPRADGRAPEGQPLDRRRVARCGRR